jgi:adenine-specific DNA-methyltransferase
MHNYYRAAMITQGKYPQFIKYMGSKSKIMNFLLEGINKVHAPGSPILDLFAGSCSLAGAIGDTTQIISNDIQTYSSIISKAYLSSFADKTMPTTTEIEKQIEFLAEQRKKEYGFHFFYDKDISLKEFNELEKKQQSIINKNFSNQWHLFVKNYAGTWWSAEQCIYIDVIRQIIEDYTSMPYYDALMACLMYAMAYTSQGTGHYAQYRDAKTESSMLDILMYRRRSVLKYFITKYAEIYEWLPQKKPKHEHRHLAVDYREACTLFKNGTIYADPPYCFVHYSRFYHALETLVKYDYPTLQMQNDEVVKGRYREDRHQSPFCIKSKVYQAFYDLFKATEQSNSRLVLSYSNTGMITLDNLYELANNIFKNREKTILSIDYKHMTLGRLNDRDRSVKECLLLI